MAANRPLNIPVILGTTRKGRMSAHAARFMVEQIEKRREVATELIDISKLPMPIDDAGDGINLPGGKRLHATKKTTMISASRPDRISRRLRVIVIIANSGVKHACVS
jgi:hypothetical protein